MSIIGLPLILFTVGDLDLSDLQFIQDRVDAGEWLEAHGAINAVTNDITIIPASGKTLYMYKAKIVPTTNGLDNSINAEFKVNGTTKDSAAYILSQSIQLGGTNQGGSGYGMGFNGGKFDVQGLSLVGDGIKEVTVENVLDDGTADATMSGWIKDT